MAGTRPKKRPHPDDVPYSLDATIKKVRKRQKDRKRQIDQATGGAKS